MTIPGDNHVHTELSWDASTGSMDRSCERALALGLPSIAFTDHADFTAWAYPGEDVDTPTLRVIDTHARSGFLEVDVYMDAVDRCRVRYPDLRILTGVEMGEPHIYSKEMGQVLATGEFERKLGSLHSMLDEEGNVAYVPMLLKRGNSRQVMERYFAELLKMVETCDVFEILAHIDYPMRAPWPVGDKPYQAVDYEEEYRGVLRELARSGRVLEVNTSGPWPAQEVLSWWYEEGGEAVSFGSDAHEPDRIAQGFQEAAAWVQSCGFQPRHDPLAFWIRS